MEIGNNFVPDDSYIEKINDNISNLNKEIEIG